MIPASKYFHILRHLKLVQIYGRLWAHIYQPKPELGPAPAQHTRMGLWQDPVRRQPSLYAPTGFRFLNESHALTSVRD